MNLCTTVKENLIGSNLDEERSIRDYCLILVTSEDLISFTEMFILLLVIHTEMIS